MNARVKGSVYSNEFAIKHHFYGCVLDVHLGESRDIFNWTGRAHPIFFFHSPILGLEYKFMCLESHIARFKSQAIEELL